jgi:hypothetical protein
MLHASPSDAGATMTLCPIAVVAGCAKCPAFSICPLKSVIGDAPKPGAAKPAAPEAKAAPKKPR